MDGYKDFLARFSKDGTKAQYLEDHVANVSQLCEKYTETIGFGDVGKLLGMIHDLGKGNLPWQEYLELSTKERLRGRKPSKTLDHATSGAQVLYDAFVKPNGIPTLSSDILSWVIASHHGMIDILKPDGNDVLKTRLAKGEAETRKSISLSLLPLKQRTYLENHLPMDLDQKLGDWVIRTKEGNDHNPEVLFIIGLLARYFLSCLVDADCTDAARFGSEKIPPSTPEHSMYWRPFLEQLETHLRSLSDGSKINTMRNHISDCSLAMAEEDPGFFRLSVPTGTGKTFASLRFALRHAEKHKMEKIIYIIPYTSIIDQTARDIRKALGVDSDNLELILEHHSNLFFDEDEKKEKKDETLTQYRILTENWNSKIILTTMVQYLEAMFGAGKSSYRRMHHMAKTVLIFDEVQSLPTNMIYLFNLSLRFLVKGCGSSVLLTTATQPLLHKVPIKSRALPYDTKREITVSSDYKRMSLDRVRVIDHLRNNGWSNEELAQLILDESRNKKSVLLIANTRAVAANVYKYLANMSLKNLYHLSTSLCPAHRKEKLAEIEGLLDKCQPVLLISTQLIEAGIDIDFDVVIRCLAGVDSVVQAAGRCNRHGRKPHQGRVIIVNSSEENLTHLPEITCGKEHAERILMEFARGEIDGSQNHLLADAVLERYFTYHFQEQRDYMGYNVKQDSNVGREDDLFRLLSTNDQSVQAYRRANPGEGPNRFLRQSFASAARCFEVIPSLGRGVIIPYKKGESIIADLGSTKDLNKLFKLLRLAQSYSVNCFQHELKTLSKEDAIRLAFEDAGVYCLHESYYHDDLGLTMHKSGSMNTSMA